MHACVCVPGCVHVCLSLGVYSIGLFLFRCVCLDVCDERVFRFVCASVYVYMCLCIYLCVRACMRACVCVHLNECVYMCVSD